MSTLSIKLPKVIDEKLTTAARKRKKAKTTVIVEALQAYFASEEEQTLTVAELAKDYIGALNDDGPADLSYNKKYLAGYGR